VGTVRLHSQPSLGPLLARAALTSRGRGGSLPDTVVERLGVVVDRPRLAAYDRVCGYPLRDALPSTYLHVLGFPLQMTLMARRDFPLALPGLVHVAGTLVQHRPVDAGERLDLRVRAARLRAHPRGRQVDLLTTASAGGEVVWTGSSTYLAKAVGTQGEKVTEDPASQVLPPVEQLPTVEPAAAPAARWRVPADTGRRYAAVSGDVNPIHLAAPAARAFGFPRALAHGMWTAARCLASLDARTPGAHEVHLAFRRPVLLPSTVELRTRRRDDGWVFAVGSASGGEHLRGVLVERP
jgi:acyl dehydratase